MTLFFAWYLYVVGVGVNNMYYVQVACEIQSKIAYRWIFTFLLAMKCMLQELNNNKKITLKTFFS